MSSSLYDRDYHQWVENTIQKSSSQQYHQVDWDNLIAEIEDMEKSQRRALASYLTRLALPPIWG
jgi:hypothetical protein